MLSFALTILSALCAGGIIGYVFGFARAAHFAALSGLRPKTRNRFLLFICRPTASYNLAEGIVFFFLMLAWLAIFFCLCGAPAIVGSKLGVDGPFIKGTYVGFFGVFLFFLRYGAKAWNALARE